MQIPGSAPCTQETDEKAADNREKCANPQNLPEGERLSGLPFDQQFHYQKFILQEFGGMCKMRHTTHSIAVMSGLEIPRKPTNRGLESLTSHSPDGGPGIR